jgi:ATP-dependent Clp protease protease subunit
MEENSEKQEKEGVQVIGNHIYFYTDVNSYSCLQAIKMIKNLNDELLTTKLLMGKDNLYNDKEEDIDEDCQDIVPIYLHINSSGGDYFSGMALVDSIRKSKVPVYTIGEGAVASMGSIIFIAGKKRFINKHSYILIHEIRSFVSGTFSNITDDFENCKTFMKDIINFYKKNTNIKKKSLKKMLKKDIWFSSKKSLKYGIADKII